MIDRVAPKWRDLGNNTIFYVHIDGATSVTHPAQGGDDPIGYDRTDLHNCFSTFWDWVALTWALFIFLRLIAARTLILQ